MSSTHIIIPANKKASILKELDSIGINQATIYPNLDKIAGYLKNLQHPFFHNKRQNRDIANITKHKNVPSYTDEPTLNPEISLIDENLLKSRIYSIRGIRMMPDTDLAEIYGYSTKRFNEQVKNNIEKFGFKSGRYSQPLAHSFLRNSCTCPPKKKLCNFRGSHQNSKGLRKAICFFLQIA